MPSRRRQRSPPPPALGEHTVEVLAESGLEPAAIRALLDAGVAFAS